MHRLLPPSAIAGVSLVCALGPWVFTAPSVLRSLAAAAAATAVAGAVVMRRWDTQAGRRVADLTRARASDEWRFEERVAELETDLEESRELRVRLEHKLRAKRTELAGLRNEHAALLRRYATAETERASALEGRRLLELEAGSDGRALPAGAADRDADGTAAVDPETAGTEATDAEATDVRAAGTEATGVEAADGEPVAVAPAVFSPEGSQLFLRAVAALARFDVDGEATAKADPAAKADQPPKDADFRKADASSDGEPGRQAAAGKGGAADAAPAREDEPQGQPEAADAHEHAAAAPTAHESEPAARLEPAGQAEPAAKTETAGQAEPTAKTEPAGQVELAVKPAQPVQQPSGHFTVPTAVAVVPAAPSRRPVVEGGFDFFGTKKGSSSAALEAVQNEDLADVVGQEALALHKAESESQYKPADADARVVGQVIDLTAHDETEQIDVQGLRTAAS
ncbi:hypothetical protein RKE30_02375 [Streptomyces sp. Li-HN-5-11]|uniref:hypothetical protein n=1 Tax=Streptomyces sp. Li-HN-5-11 TaxID=3075432 RepID=UPI0028A9A543|nr:hypothetical protein [Streptomyces sp. Li-HN-5-11]WNM29321.1 hypothetical protein RKE30_02375 [Streptomyces sp. Li-HN-5-11]